MEQGKGFGWLGQRIAASGRNWGYDEFVEAALYDEEHGFYGSGKGSAGRRGDFLTSPEVGPLFGAVVARALDTWWEELGSPRRFTIVEVGAGRGTLARAILAAEPKCAPHYITVERSCVLRESQPSAVTAFGDVSELTDPFAAGVVLANELLDNLPFALAECVPGGWREVLVGPDLAEMHGDLLPQDFAPGASLGLRLGARIPLQRQAARWPADASALLRTGMVVAFDYTSPTTAALAARPWQQWLRTYRNHEAGGHPLDVPGEQDVTVEVAIDQLPTPDWTYAQADFLHKHGIGELVAAGRAEWAARAGIGDLAALRARSRIREAEALSDPTGLGGFSVLGWQVRGLP